MAFSFLEAKINEILFKNGNRMKPPEKEHPLVAG
jgi:hypothetical protein